jgi:hypothetical protein
LDAIQIPIDQLKRLSLGDNPFVCNCSLIWLWHLVKLSSAAHPERVNSNNNSQAGSNKSSNLFIIDKDRIGCDIIVKGDDNDVKVIRKSLLDMSESEVSCPTNLLTMISVILTVVFIAIICISIFVVIKCSSMSRKRQQQQKCFSSERHNIGEIMIPQKVDKSELERYLAEQHYQHQEKLQQYTINNRSHDQYNLQQNNVNNPGGYHSLKSWEQHPSTLNNFNSFNSKHSLSNQKHSNDGDDEDEINPDEDHYENFDENYFGTIGNQSKKMPQPQPPPLSTITHPNVLDRGTAKGSKTNLKPHIVYV